MVYQGAGAARQSKNRHKGAWPLCGGCDVCGPSHHNIRRFSAKSRFSLNVVMVLLPCRTIEMPAAKQQQRRGNRRYDHARPYERLLHAKCRRQPRGNRQRRHAGEHIAKTHDRVHATELLERSRRLHNGVMKRVNNAPGHAQDNLADKGYANMRRPHVNQASHAHGHKRHEQRF